MGLEAVFAHGAMHAIGGTFEPATRSLVYTANPLAPNVIPPPEALMEVALKGWVAEVYVEQALHHHGIQLNVTGKQPIEPTSVGINNVHYLWNRVYWASQEIPGGAELMRMRNRDLLTQKQYNTMLRRRGFYDVALRHQFADLRWEIPSSADLVRFSIRHVFEPDLIEKLRYNDEFNPYLDFWHKMQGLNYPILGGPFQQQWEAWYAKLPPVEKAKIKPYEAYHLTPPTWAQAFWWSHWVLPSPTQGYQMWFKLDQNRDRSFDAPEMEGLNFNYSDLELLLRANDYPPYYRAKLAAISRPIPGIRFAREFRRTGVYNFENLLEWARRQGYAPRDQRDIAENIELAAQKAESKETACRQCTTLERAYRVGVLTRPQLVFGLESYGLSPQEAEGRAQVTDLELGVERSRQVIAALRRQYLSGDLDDQQATLALTQYGLAADRVQDYVMDWEIEKRTNWRHVSAQKSIKWACDGLIPIDDLIRRLTNLNYQVEDIAVMVDEAKQCALTLAARAAAAGQRQEEKRARELLAAQRAARQALLQARRALASHGSPVQLRKWFCEGHIGEQELYGRLQFLGWPDADISRLIGDCGSGKGGKRGPAGGGP